MPSVAHIEVEHDARSLTAVEVLYATKGALLQGSPAVSFSRIATDSRTAKEGDLFVCLKGEQFDGHDFVPEALAKGVSSLLVGKGCWSVNKNLCAAAVVIEVDNTLTALGDIAAFWRSTNPVQVIAITGSCGKTTTKEMTADILAKRFPLTKTIGNFNNLIGLPLSLLSVKPTDKVVVLEMGMNRFGEIARLSEIAQPDIGVITNVQMAHLEGLRSVEGVARAKGELYAHLKAKDLAVFNADDPQVTALARKCKARKLGFGISAEADIRARDVVCHPNGTITFSLAAPKDTIDITLHSPGRHNVMNALAASASAIALGVDLSTVKEGLEEFRTLANRLEIIKLGPGLTIINDTYNANPGSMRAALETLKEIKGPWPGIAVLGDMLELGEQSAPAHHSAGEHVAALGIEYLIVLGDFASQVADGAASSGMDPDHIFTVSSHEEAVETLKKVRSSLDFVLVKGSRGMRMEKVVQRLQGVA